MSVKKCTECGAKGEFYKDVTHADGMTSKCKSCVNAKRAQYRALNRARIASHAVKYRERTQERQCWNAMIRRCTDPNNIGYANYGGRGISVCERWLKSFDAFLSDMGPRPSIKHTVDRINTDIGYEPANCRWLTQRDQCRNKRNNVNLTYHGKTMCAKAWADELGVSKSLILSRIKAGWTIERTLCQPVRGK